MDVDSIDIDEQLAILEEIEGIKNANLVHQIMGGSDGHHSKNVRKHLIDLDSPEEGPSTSYPPKRRKTLIPDIPPAPKRSE
ncbi:unnamed protein product, partial [Hymenolepis diminuta]